MLGGAVLQVNIPMLKVTGHSAWAISWSRAVCRRGITVLAVGSSVSAGARHTHLLPASPRYRWRQLSLIRSATRRGSLSPIRCPEASLTALKLSRSRKTTVRASGACRSFSARYWRPHKTPAGSGRLSVGRFWIIRSDVRAGCEIQPAGWQRSGKWPGDGCIPKIHELVGSGISRQQVAHQHDNGREQGSELTRPFSQRPARQ